MEISSIKLYSRVGHNHLSIQQKCVYFASLGVHIHSKLCDRSFLRKNTFRRVNRDKEHSSLSHNLLMNISRNKGGGLNECS